MANHSSPQGSSHSTAPTLSQQPTLVTTSTPTLPPPGEAFKTALKKFRARLTGKDLAAFQITTYDDLCREIVRIQNEQDTRREMMNLARMQSCLEAMNQFGKVIEVFLNVSTAVAFVWGPMKLLLMTASEFTDSFEALLGAYEQIGEQMPLLSEYESLFHQSPHMINALELMYIDILDFHQHAMLSFSGSNWKRFFRSIIAQYRRYQEDIADLKSKLNKTISEEQQKKLRAVKEWLAVGQQIHQDHVSFCDIRKQYSSTARWILKHEFVKDWMGADVPPTPVLWINGIPGAGKTILASAIIDECKQKTDFNTSFFYCREEDHTSNSAVGILKGIVEQLLDQHPQLLPACYARYSSSGEPSLRSLSQAKRLVEDFCFTDVKTFVVVDGLDECEPVERKQLLDILVNIVGVCDTHEPGKLRMLLVSQDYSDIRRALHSSAVTRLTPRIVQISDTDNESDIRAYVRFEVDRIASKHSPITDDMKEYVRNLTVANAKGMFLYAKLVMCNLYAQPTRNGLIDAIKTTNFPNGLEEAWEIQVALSLNTDNQTIEYNDRHLRTHIHDICGALVLLCGDHVSLVHSTARTYITNVTKEIHEPSIECEFAILCLQYLTFPCFDTEQCNDQHELRQLTLEGHFGFQDYAVAKWFHHVNAFVNTGQRLLGEANDLDTRLEALSHALDDFMARYDEVDWDDGLVEECKTSCMVFQALPLYENLLLLSSHIYAFQKKGFEARHKVSIKGLDSALQRNRKVLEDLPKQLSTSELVLYRQFYDEERRYKCTKITCRYFSEGFKDEKARKRHVNIHERPFQCEVSDCLGAEGFANPKDLEKHTRAFHPELSDLAEKFHTATVKHATSHACSICGQTFTRNFHLKNHELSHRGLKPHECPECGRAFTRLNDCKRHRKLHDRS
ncbi:C2H2 domain-containing protein [Dothidotthia symphoricarpi CBS 119687]|uniref:C2H2 domain-containing protein n=1 Tax=Dothidotthia symphoricarpi CBS 119687 TaxID=1392245 RepID=A0A6A6A8T0_9PLEO|nr:C2H2 domain-containing protein [Dothidotthia symphoricarpi CBS 119687]KAF2128362.1 C2H2 domain-containing protein [Dothidotthia symphoricarpi CBS 119687]